MRFFRVRTFESGITAVAVALAAMCGRIGTNRSRHDFRGDNKEIRIRKRTMTFLMNVEVRKKKKEKKEIQRGTK